MRKKKIVVVVAQTIGFWRNGNSRCARRVLHASAERRIVFCWHGGSYLLSAVQCSCDKNQLEKEKNVFDFVCRRWVLTSKWKKRRRRRRRSRLNEVSICCVLIFSPATTTPSRTNSKSVFNSFLSSFSGGKSNKVIQHAHGAGEWARADSGKCKDRYSHYPTPSHMASSSSLYKEKKKNQCSTTGT